VSNPKRSVVRACLGIPLLYGLVPIIVGYLVLRESPSASALLVVFAALCLAGGIVMASSAFFLLVTLGRSSTAAWTGGIASLLNAGLFAWVTFTDVLPCSGPG
jgi:hypothetical protein